MTTAEAEEEYKRVFAECLENNFDLDLATKTAKAAMRAALNIVDSEDEESEGDDDEDAEMEDLTRGITVIELHDCLSGATDQLRVTNHAGIKECYTPSGRDTFYPSPLLSSPPVTAFPNLMKRCAEEMGVPQVHR